MATILLGATGKLGGVLRRANARATGRWLTQARSEPADLIWSGQFDSSHQRICQPGATLINMIGATGRDEAVLQATNVQFVRDLLQHAAAAGVRHVILASSAAVYGAGSGVPFAEDAPLRPVNSYGVSKMGMERVAHDMAVSRPDIAITILRIGNVAGSDALLASARHHHAQGSPVPLHRFSDGSTPVRSYIGPKDLSHVVDHFVAHPKPGATVYNVAAPDPVSLRDMIGAYRTHLLPQLVWEDRPAPDGTPERVVLSTDRLLSVVELPHPPDPADAMARQVFGDCPP